LKYSAIGHGDTEEDIQKSHCHQKQMLRVAGDGFASSVRRYPDLGDAQSSWSASLWQNGRAKIATEAKETH